MNRPIMIIILAVALQSPFNFGKAAEIRAFHNINQLPFKQIFGLPSLDNSLLTEAGKWRFNLISNLSNTYSNTIGSSEQLETDCETLRASLIVNYGLRDNLQLSLEVPYVNHGKGFLDDFIYDWHDFLNLPQNGRTKASSDQLYISYESGGTTLFELSGPENGLGDIRVNGAFSKPWNNRTLIFSAELKLPTGDYARLTGSGGYDFSLGLMLNDPLSLEKYRITLYGGFAGLYLGDMDGALGDIQKNFVIAGRAGFGWKATKIIHFKLQLDALSALYDSELKDLGDPAFQLTTGVSLVFTDDFYLDLSIAEDIGTLTAADVTFQLALVAAF